MLPELLRFRDSDDRNSLEDVDPEHLEAMLGSGVSLASATFQIVDEPVSPMPSAWPEWLQPTDRRNNRGIRRFGGYPLPFSTRYFLYGE
jgi:hypothetical protein